MNLGHNTSEFLCATDMLIDVECHLALSSWKLSEPVTHIATKTFGLDVCFSFRS